MKLDFFGDSSAGGSGLQPYTNLLFGLPSPINLFTDSYITRESTFDSTGILQQLPPQWKFSRSNLCIFGRFFLSLVETVVH